MKWQMYSNSNLLQQGMHCKCTHVACGAEGRGKRRARATSAGGGGGGEGWRGAQGGGLNYRLNRKKV
jgi:hypothetical protein